MVLRFVFEIFQRLAVLQESSGFIIIDLTKFQTGYPVWPLPISTQADTG